MIRIAPVTVGLLLLVAQTVDAQFVRIGPWGGVSVRAPFVRVEVSPSGGTYVRAPFTEVQTPGRFGPSAYGGYGYTPYREPALPYDGYSPAPFDGATGGVTQDESRMRLRDVQRSLVANWNTLRADLERFGTGAGWRDYLRLPEGVLSADPRAISEAELEELGEVLARYDEVAEAEEYRMISRLGSFERTHRRLATYLERLSGASPPTDTEELPPPQDVAPRS